MSYFKGSRRRVKKGSHSLSSSESGGSKTGHENTDMQAVDLPANGQIQKKRPQTVDSTKREQTKRPKRTKPQRSSSKSFVASNGHGKKANKKVTKTTNDNDNPGSLITTGHNRNKEVIQTGSLSSSESEGNLVHLSDESDLLHVTESNPGDLCEQSDRKFLQQQIKILKMPFQLEKDCPSLSRIKEKDSKHIPLQVIHNTLRKVNHKTEDEILRNLNRPAQRKLLESLHATRSDPPESSTTAVSDELLKSYKEVQIRVANLEKAHHEVTQEHTKYKCIGVLVSQLKENSEEFNNKELMDEIQKTNDFIENSSQVSTSKNQDLDSNAGVGPGVAASDYISSTHKQLVQMLFKD